MYLQKKKKERKKGEKNIVAKLIQKIERQSLRLL